MPGNTRGGLAGKIAFVDLTKRKIRLEESEKYGWLVGGRGFGAYLLFQELEPSVKPLDPDNLVVISPGRLVGTECPQANRTNLSSKSPVTGGIGYSNVGGSFGYRLKRAGFDAIVVHGRSEKPVYLWVLNDSIEVRDATHLWGLTTSEVFEQLRELENEVSVLSIGPAGENLVFASAVIVDEGNAAGGCGIASVLGSKKLKAVAVYGDKEVPVANPEKLHRLREEIINRIEKSNHAKIHKTHGSVGRVLPRFQKLSMLPVRNYEDDTWDERKLNRLLEGVSKLRVGMKGCPQCFMQCMNVLEIREGKYAGTRCVGLQANAGYGFGPRFDVDDPLAVVKANALCNELGLDIDNAATIISWIFELYNKGLINRDEVDGLDLRWGNGEALLEMLKKLAYRDGVGEILARGFKQAASIIGRGSEYYAMQVKNQGIIDSVRTAIAWGFGHLTSVRGARHLDGSPTTEARDYTPTQSFELFKVPTASIQTVYEGKAELVFWFENFKSITDALGICYFATYWGNALELLGPEDYAALYHAVVGEEVSPTELLLVGRKIREYEKAFNTIHANFTRIDDMPPPRVFVEGVKSGPLKGIKIDWKKYDEMLSEYYRLHGWDEDTGLQKRETLSKLGLHDVISKLERFGKID